MPQIRIETKKGKDRQFLKNFINVTMSVIGQVLILPENDRNIRLMEYEQDLFSTKPPYEYIIEIMLFEGRTKDTKKKLFSSVVGALNSELGVPKEAVIIILNEQPLGNWGIRGGIPADEIDLGFKVNV